MAREAGQAVAAESGFNTMVLHHDFLVADDPRRLRRERSLWAHVKTNTCPGDQMRRKRRGRDLLLGLRRLALRLRHLDGCLGIELPEPPHMRAGVAAVVIDGRAEGVTPGDVQQPSRLITDWAPSVRHLGKPILLNWTSRDNCRVTAARLSQCREKRSPK